MENDIFCVLIFLMYTLVTSAEIHSYVKNKRFMNLFFAVLWLLQSVWLIVSYWT